MFLTVQFGTLFKKQNQFINLFSLNKNLLNFAFGIINPFFCDTASLNRN